MKTRGQQTSCHLCTQAKSQEIDFPNITQLPPIVALERPLSLSAHKSAILTKGQVINHNNLASFMSYMPLFKENESALLNSVGLTRAGASFKGVSGPQPMALNDDSHLLPQVPLITTPFSMALPRPAAINISQLQPTNCSGTHASSPVATRYQLLHILNGSGPLCYFSPQCVCGGNILWMPQFLWSQSYHPHKSSSKSVCQHLSH